MIQKDVITIVTDLLESPIDESETEEDEPTTDERPAESDAPTFVLDTLKLSAPNVAASTLRMYQGVLVKFGETAQQWQTYADGKPVITNFRWVNDTALDRLKQCPCSDHHKRNIACALLHVAKASATEAYPLSGPCGASLCERLSAYIDDIKKKHHADSPARKKKCGL